MFGMYVVSGKAERRGIVRDCPVKLKTVVNYSLVVM